MLIDVHCHFFTKSLVTDAIANEGARLNSVKNDAFKKRAVNLSEDIAKIIRFMEIAFLNTTEQHYMQMKQSYGEDFIAVPLMLDLAYALDMSLSVESTPTQRMLNRLQRGIKGIANNGNKKFVGWADDTVSNLGQALRKHNPNNHLNIFEHSYQDQISDLINIKNKFPDRIYPFFSIDPRRESQFEGGVLGQVKKYVGPDKPFIGLKLYPSLGYSPTDPVLYDDGNRETVLSWCEANNIPITAHCAPNGFSHFVELVKINGDIYHPASGSPMPASAIFENGIVKFTKNIPFQSSNSVIEERLSMLTHPVLWRKVLTRYPKLKLNLAHCGGHEQIMSYMDGAVDAFWPKQILDLVLKFENTYTDLSCFNTIESSSGPISNYHAQIYKNLPRSAQQKILWGSDFFMLTLFEDNLTEYYQKFKRGFGKDFKRISQRNNALFLGLEKQNFVQRLFSI